MKKNAPSYPYKLLENLKMLRQEECKRFRRWLESPWCNSRKKLATLFRLLVADDCGIGSAALDLEKLHRKLYPGRAYQHKSMLNLLSDLSVEVENFLVHETVKQSPDLCAQLLRSVFGTRGRADKEIQSLQETIDRLGSKRRLTEAETLEIAQAREQQYWRQATALRGQSEIRQLEHAQFHLDQYYVQVRLRIMVELSERTQVLGGRADHPLSDQLGDLQRLIPDLTAPAARWYATYLSGQKGLSPQDFAALREHFLESLPELEKKDKMIILLLLINETARMKLQGRSGVLETTLELYQLGLSENILLYQGEMTPRTFANIVATANGLRRYEYVKQFVGAYARALSPDVRGDARLWALALTAYLQQAPELEKLLRELEERQRSVQTTTFSLRISVLLTQARFDAYWRNEETLDDAFWKYNDAFAKRLQRRKYYSEKHIRALKRFSNYVRKLAELIPLNSANREDFRQLKVAVQQENTIHAKDWLLVRMQMLEGE